MREEMDEFENYCLAYGIQGKRWTAEDPWMYRRYRSLDDTNGMITDSEREMEEKINSRKKYKGIMSSVLYVFLISIYRCK